MNLSKVLHASFRFALPFTIFVMIAFNLIRDVPWDDEAGYHLDGVLMVAGKMGNGFTWGLDGTLNPGEKVSYTLNGLVVFSPLYSFFAGLIDFLFGVELGIHITWIAGGLGLIAIFAMVLKELEVPKVHRIVALCILSASSISTSWVGVSRAGITFALLAGLVALRFPRRYWSGLAILVLIVLGSLCRLEAVFAAPPLIWLWGREPNKQQHHSLQINPVYRWTLLFISFLLIIGTLAYTAEMRESREWLAFQQHYTVLNQYRLSADSNPWRDMSLMETDFPGATSVGQALSVNPKLAIKYYLEASLRACWTALASAAPRARLWFLSCGVFVGMIFTLWLDGTRWRDLALRAWTIISRPPSGPILAALILASASSFLVVAEPRHVVGLTVAILLFATLLVQHPARLTRALMIVAVGLWISGAFGLTLLELTKPRINSVFVSTAKQAVEQVGRPLVAISYESNLTCMYLEDQCSEFSSLRVSDPCTYFDQPGDLIVTLTNQRPKVEQCSQGWQLAAYLYNYDLWLHTQSLAEE